jgi:hypothetical protein
MLSATLQAFGRVTSAGRRLMPTARIVFVRAAAILACRRREQHSPRLTGLFQISWVSPRLRRRVLGPHQEHADVGFYPASDAGRYCTPLGRATASVA